jgi:tRNA(fMet)-specific endonuclease VapC
VICMVCLDTSVLVALIRRDQAAIDGLTAEAERGGTVSTTVVNLCELYSGAYGSKNPQKELAKVQDLVSNLGLLELDAGAAKRYGELVNDATLKRAPIGDFDLIIASIALEQEEKLVTRNVKHFSRVPGLTTEQW